MNDLSLHQQFMRIAIKLSEENVGKVEGGPFGAVIVKDDHIVAKSANRVIAFNDPTAHAEISAIRLACEKLNTYDLTGCVIYTSCEPCPMCLGAIYWSKISKVYYANTKNDAAEIGFNDKFIYDELEMPLEKRSLPLVQLLRNEAVAVFQSWNTSESKVHY